MNDLTLEVFKTVVTQGPLVGFLFFLYIQNNKKLDLKDQEIAELNKEMRVSLENNLTKSNDALNNNTVALNALKDAFKR